MMAENCPILANDRNLQIPIAEQTPNRINQKKSTPTHKTVKFLKAKDKEKKSGTQQEKNNT